MIELGLEVLAKEVDSLLESNHYTNCDFGLLL